MHFVQSRCAPLIPHSLSHSTGLSLSSLSYYSPIVLFSFTQSTDNYSLFDRPTYTVEAVPLHLHFLPLLLHFSAWPDWSILALHQKRHWKSLFSRLICPLIHLSSSTSSVLTCPPPKDPLHASSPAQPAPRRRLLLPLFFQSSSFSLRGPSSSPETLIVLSLFTQAFSHQGRCFYSRFSLFLKPQTIIHILCRLVQCTLVSHLHNGLSPAYLRLLAQKCVILNTCPELTGVIIGLRLEPHDNTVRLGTIVCPIPR